MIRNVLIDPYMFLIEAEEEIRKNISFFNKVIRLHQKNKVAIFIYQRWYEKLKEMSFQPFPISTLEIKDRNLKENILRLNSSFLHLMVDNFIVIEIDSCNGEQEFISDVKIVEDSEYYELHKWRKYANSGKWAFLREKSTSKILIKKIHEYGSTGHTHVFFKFSQALHASV